MLGIALFALGITFAVKEALDDSNNINWQSYYPFEAYYTAVI
jgi:hypothetical protein